VLVQAKEGEKRKPCRMNPCELCMHEWMAGWMDGWTNRGPFFTHSTFFAGFVRGGALVRDRRREEGVG